MKIKFTLVHGPLAQKFIENLKASERDKIYFNIKKTEIGIRGEWFRKMPGTDDIWEFRTYYNKKYLRLFAFWDTRDKKNPIILTTNGIVKKTGKTPKKDIEIAERVKHEYFKRTQ